MEFSFVVGEIYNRKQDLHAHFGGSHQAGIANSSTHPVVFLFTKPSGAEHGYVDRFDEDGLFAYSGEGRTGDMDFTKGNLALRDHIDEQRHALLFEHSHEGYWRFVGEVYVADFRWQEMADRNGDFRKGIVFRLAIGSLPVASSTEPQGDPNVRPRIEKSASLRQLRMLARDGKTEPAQRISRAAIVYVRSEAIKVYARARAKGVCELCNEPAPFMDRKQQPFLEVHHMTRIADGGPDVPENVAALCPNCHRQIHAGYSGLDTNQQLISRILELEAVLAESSN